MITELTNQILSYPAGGTVRTDGRPTPTHGYFVGGAGRSLAFELKDGALGAAWAADSIREFLTGIELDGAMYIGWWTDSETGKLWLDTVTWTANYDHAEQWCTNRREIAFYDIARGQEIRPAV